PNIVINETYQHILWDMSLRGGSAFNEEDAGDILGFHDFFEITRPSWLHNYPRESFSARIGKIDIKMMRTMHIPDSSFNWQSSFWSCGIVIENRVLFTSDTRYDPELIISFDEIFDIEMIFHDCQFFTGGVHASLDELNQLPAKIKAKTYLTHYGDNWEDFETTVDECGFAGLAKQHTHYIF
ncbi:MAG: MBL fold metallo-hydrolase, partial [Spirochaetota bacterium]